MTNQMFPKSSRSGSSNRYPNVSHQVSSSAMKLLEDQAAAQNNSKFMSSTIERSDEFANQL